MTKPNPMGLRELTDAEIGFLRTTRNYSGGLILSFIAMDKDAAALDANDDREAEKLVKTIRNAANRAGLGRYIQSYCNGKVVILSRPAGAEKLKLSPEQEAKLQ